MIEHEFKIEIISHLEKDGSNFIIKMLSNFEKWKLIDKTDIIELLSAAKTNELSLYYMLQFFHLYLGVKIEPLYKELNEQIWKSETCLKIHAGFSKIPYLFSQISFSRLKKSKVSRNQLLNVRSRLIKQGIDRVRQLSIELPKN